MIIYFTGTGNSKFVADMMADLLDDEAVNSLPYLKEGIGGEFHSEKPFVFVFPTYVSMIPYIFRDFIRKSTFTGSDKAYFVPTTAMTSSQITNSAESMCDEKPHLTYMGYRAVIMPQNYIMFSKITEKKEQLKRYKRSELAVDIICRAIKAGKRLDYKPSNAAVFNTALLTEKLYYKYYAKTSKFTVSDDCVGCGICEKYCAIDAIEIRDGKPVWVKPTCVHCCACVNYCPHECIEYGNKTQGKERYKCISYKKYKAQKA